MTVELDAAANVVGRYEGRPAGTAGAAARLAHRHGARCRALRRQSRRDRRDRGRGGAACAPASACPSRSRCIAFGDEEGVRFPSKLTGSRAVAGTFDPQSLDVDRPAGHPSRGGPARLRLRPRGDPRDRPAAASAVLGYVEVHIEQGPVLEQLKLPVGVVTAIDGASRFRIEVIGEAGHAGTVPMALAQGRADRGRGDDPGGRAPRCRCARAQGWSRPWASIEAIPGAPNVIPGKATFTLDVRAPVDADRLKAIEDLVGRVRRPSPRAGMCGSRSRSSTTSRP